MTGNAVGGCGPRVAGRTVIEREEPETEAPRWAPLRPPLATIIHRDGLGRASRLSVPSRR